MKLAVVGSGYVGLVAGACLAETGNDVVCVDKDESKIRMLRRGQIPIFEPGLEELVRRNRAEKRLTFTTQLARAVRSSSVIFIAVGTPQDEDGSADLQHVLGVTRDIARAMNGYKVVVNKSTVPVGTAEKVREIIRRETTHPFSVVSNPEFLKQGAAVDDFLKPDRVVIGAEDEKAAGDAPALRAVHPHRGAHRSDGLLECRAVQGSAANARETAISFMNGIATSAKPLGQWIRAEGDRIRPTHQALVPLPDRYGSSCSRKTSRPS